uniref:DUF1007 family protein n=1 Tax=Pararhizobium sp. IMCC3301 TaxID=3067904 RepID=UPI0027411A8E|nr:DUF1007 family protein [Pararhizobium sp. IMCC3301]
MESGRIARYWLIFVSILVSAFVPVQSALAHPHEFVEMKVAVHFDKAGKASSVKYSWLFDEFFSAYLIEPADTDGDGKPEQEGLDALFIEILGNIEEINYFTKFEKDSLDVEFGKPKPLVASMKKRQLYLEFELPFKMALDLQTGNLEYAIYDDEFYIAMNHSTDADAVKLVGAPMGCEWTLLPPNPSEDVAAFAKSLDKTESGGSGLGANFAERVTIKCT